MPVLNIEGRRVTVDESFLSLSPEEQNRTVEDIVSQMGGSAVIEGAGTRETPAQQPRMTQEAPTPSAERSMSGAGVTWLENAVSGIPIVGPALQKGSDYLGTEAYGFLTGEDPAKLRSDMQERRQARNEEYPASAVSGTVAANIAPLAAIGRTAAGAEVLGVTGKNLFTRAANSGLSSAAISGADTAARGGDLFDSASNALISGGIGTAIPVVGTGLQMGLQAAGERIYPAVNALRNPAREAERRVGMAVARDMHANPASVMTDTDRAVAQSNNLPLVNADAGGETTRALARSVANQSPEARAVIDKTANDRFATQSQRATEFVRRLTSSNADDVAYREVLLQQSRAANKPAYEKAYATPQAKQLYTPGLQELMQSPSVRKAVATVPARSADRGAVEGFKEIGNPFTVNRAGQYVLRKNANGDFVAPNLRFWDQVKRNLDSQISAATREGDKPLVADLTALHRKLVGELDTAVPAFKTARQGAAGFFDAENALDAGRKFATTPKAIPEAQKAYSSFSAPEKSAFATGYASELIDRIKASPDRANIINGAFKSEASRESMSMVFGPQKMREIEAYVRVEDLADRLRGAMGNSTTARQLVELGIGAGGGAVVTGDWKGALTGAAVVKGARYLGQRVDEKVMFQVANLLMKDNPSALKIAIQQASRKPAFMESLERLGNALALPARGSAIMATQ